MIGQEDGYLPLTFAQRKALGQLVRGTRAPRTAKSLYTRSDVLWRLEERGLVSRSFADLWYVTPAGEAAYEAWHARNRSDA